MGGLPSSVINPEENCLKPRAGCNLKSMFRAMQIFVDMGPRHALLSATFKEEIMG